MTRSSKTRRTAKVIKAKFGDQAPASAPAEAPQEDFKRMTDDERRAYLAARKCFVLLSGGKKSIALAYHIKSKGFNDITCVTFVYKGMPAHELISAREAVAKLGARHIVHTTESLHPEFPNFMSEIITRGWSEAVRERAFTLAVGVSRMAHPDREDHRAEYIRAINIALYLGTKGQGGDDLTLYTPYTASTIEQVEAELAQLTEVKE